MDGGECSTKSRPRSGSTGDAWDSSDMASARASVCGLPARFRLRQLHREQPSDPEEDEVEQQEDQQARLRPDALDDQPDEIIGNVAERHETHIVENQLHDAVSTMRIVPALVLAQDLAEER